MAENQKCRRAIWMSKVGTLWKNGNANGCFNTWEDLELSSSFSPPKDTKLGTIWYKTKDKNILKNEREMQWYLQAQSWKDPLRRDLLSLAFSYSTRAGNVKGYEQILWEKAHNWLDTTSTERHKNKQAKPNENNFICFFLLAIILNSSTKKPNK